MVPYVLCNRISILYSLSGQMGKYEADSSYFEQDCAKDNLRLLHVLGDKSDFNKYLASGFSLLHISTHYSLGSNKTKTCLKKFPYPSKMIESYHLNHHHHSHELYSCTYKYERHMYTSIYWPTNANNKKKG